VLRILLEIFAEVPRMPIVVREMTVFRSRAPESATVLHFFWQGGLGDRVMFQGIVRALFGDGSCPRRQVAVIPWFGCAYDARSYRPTLDEVWGAGLTRLRDTRDVADVLVCLRNLAHQFYPASSKLTICWYANTGFDPCNTPGVEVLQPYPYLGRLVSEGAAYPSFHVHRESSSRARDLLVSAGVVLTRDKVVAIHCRQHSIERWRNLSVRCVEALLSHIRYHLGAKIVAIGGEDMPKGVRGAADLAVPVDPSLQLPAAILRLSGVFIGGNSGPGHLAAAVGTPVVSIQNGALKWRSGPFCPEERIVRVNATPSSRDGLLEFDPRQVTNLVGAVLDREVRRKVAPKRRLADSGNSAGCYGASC
jgi:hypothetical protein